MTLVKTSILSFIATAIKILAGLVINKAVSVYIGPSGLALIGQFQNFTQIAMTTAQGGINNGVTKYAAEYGKHGTQIPHLFSTAAKISILSSTIVGIGSIALSTYLSKLLLNTEEYNYIFVIYGITLTLFVINNLLLSILNGINEIRIWTLINITQSIYGLIFTSILIIFLGLDGALIALATNQSVIFIATIWMLRKHPIININNFQWRFNTNEATKLSQFTAMALTSAAMTPLSNLIIRDHISEAVSWDAAGYWQAIQYISTTYLLIVTTTLSTYFLPRFSAVSEKTEMRKEIANGYKIVMPIVIISTLIIYIQRDLIIEVLFTKDFLPMRELFLWQLIGDTLKIASWIPAILMIAKAMTKQYIYTEITFNSAYTLLSIWMIDKYGLVGTSYSFAINYGAYLILALYATRKNWTR